MTLVLVSALVLWHERQILEDELRTRAELLAQIPYEGRRLNGTLPWYGEEYDLEDFIIYTFYGHKREHSAQIAAFRDQLAREVSLPDTRMALTYAA